MRLLLDPRSHRFEHRLRLHVLTPCGGTVITVNAPSWRCLELSSARACASSGRLAAPGSSALPGRGRASGRAPPLLQVLERAVSKAAHFPRLLTV